MYFVKNYFIEASGVLKLNSMKRHKLNSEQEAITK